MMESGSRLSRGPRNLLQGNKGAFTIEASLIFPILLLANVAFILFALYVYQLVTLQMHAAAAAERIALHWHESPVEGRLPLYWRITNNGGTSVNIPASGHASYSGGSIEEQKMERGIRGIPEGISGTVEYDKRVIRTFVVVKLKHPMKISAFIRFFIPDIGSSGEIHAEAAAEVMDSTEFSRYIDFAFGYALKKDKNSLTATQGAFTNMFSYMKTLIK